MGIATRILAKKSKETVGKVKGFFSRPHEEEAPRIYPLGLRLNAVLRFDPTDFILAGDSLKVELPSGDLAIVAVGEFRCLGITFYRFYLKDLKDNDWVLQVADDNGTQELVLLQTLDEIYPDDWGFWLNDQTGLIGYKDFQTPDQLTYFRTLGSNGPDHVDPVTFQEVVRSGEDTFSIDHAMMLYQRDFQVAGTMDLTEYLLVSRELDEEGTLVHIMSGVPVNPMSLTVL
jgi:hypothetical protein